MSDYTENAARALTALRGKENKIILAIESSCDETACAILRGKSLIANVVASQIEIHRRFGGVVPEIASRNHTLAIEQVVKEAIKEARIGLHDVDCFAVTYGAGLLGALLVGVSYAKSLAYGTGKPLIAVNHIRGHIAANYLADESLRPPYLCLIASGGHTAIARVDDFMSIETVGATLDDACGEAFDKVARAMGLPYPGGVQIERLAKEGEPVVPLPTPFKGEMRFDFSYSGLKTAVINYIHKHEQSGLDYNKADLAASFQEKAIGQMVERTIRAAKAYGYSTIVIAGGVGANVRLRALMAEYAAESGVKVIYPPLHLCTDNAAMIASQARVMIENGCKAADLDLDAQASVRIGD